MKKNVLLKKQWYQRRVRGAQMEVQLSKEGNIFILRINDGKDNRTTLDLLHQLDGVLDEVEQSVGPAALVTIGSPKFYSNGIPTEGTTPEILAQISLKLYACLARLVVFPIPTVAIVTGHAVGGGAMLALAHDFRIMNSERGWFYYPAVDIGVILPPPLTYFLQTKVRDPSLVRELLLEGKKFSGTEAFRRGLVDKCVGPRNLLEEVFFFVGCNPNEA
eukprot:TRINITY_DN913_c0_g1_i5.p1 TRINITY_DN913_c0_g1~~TRINITY_DN913_c0_g1_i5.p1  ORF type:complete len:218 (+),score=43.30 TRINITY_DN913_c0_g1_i5:594-1247(+)